MIFVSPRTSLGETAAPELDLPLFDLPLDCLTGADCFVQHYVDHEPGDGFRDYRCGFLSNNGHKGTDFRLRDFKMMEAGVKIRAAAAGTVVNIRDGMPDVHVRLVGKDAVFDRGLGNAVVIDHGGGWKSIYGHLRRNSVTVKTGQRVSTRDHLGTVGLSGLTEFPHLHFQVNYKGAPVDPFTGLQSVHNRTCTRSTKASLWRKRALDALTYRRTFLLHAGFSLKPMRRAALQYGLHERTHLPRSARNLLFGVFFSGAHEGDEYQLRLFDPNGANIFDKTGIFDKSTAVKFLFDGILNRDQSWAVGRYRARFELRARGALILSVDRHMEFR